MGNNLEKTVDETVDKTTEENTITLVCKDYDGNEIEVHDFTKEGDASRVTIVLSNIEDFDVDDYTFSEDLGEWDSYSVSKVINVEEMTLNFLISIYLYVVTDETDEIEEN